MACFSFLNSFTSAKPSTNEGKNTNIWSPQFIDRMALYTGYAGIKQELLLQAPHRIPNTMEPRTSALAVTSFLQENATLSVMHFLPNLLALSIDGVECDRSDAPMFI